MDIVHDQPLYQEVNVGKQRREYHHLHKDLNGNGDIAGEHGFRHGNGGDEIEALRHTQHAVGVRVVDLRLEPHPGLYLHTRRGIIDGESTAPRVAAVIADNGQRIVADDNTAGLPDVAVSHRLPHLSGDGTLELVGVIAHLHKAPLRQRDTGVFSGNTAVGG